MIIHCVMTIWTRNLLFIAYLLLTACYKPLWFKIHGHGQFSFIVNFSLCVEKLEFFSEHAGIEFVSFLLAFIEEPPETDSDDVIPDIFLRLVLAYNLQFPTHSSQNLVLEALAIRNNAKVYTEKILLLLNREGAYKIL